MRKTQGYPWKRSLEREYFNEEEAPEKSGASPQQLYSYLENISIHAGLFQQRQIIVSYFFEIYNSASFL